MDTQKAVFSSASRLTTERGGFPIRAWQDQHRQELLRLQCERIESAEFAARIGLASGFTTAKRYLAEDPATVNLQEGLRGLPEHGVVTVLKRMLWLVLTPTDERYEHLHDVPLLGYLWVLSKRSWVDAADVAAWGISDVAAELVLATDRLWWSERLAKEILSKDRE